MPEKRQRQTRLRIVAIVAAYNEADVVGQVVRALIDDGVEVYFLDNHSTDRTAAAVTPFLGKGVIAIETFPPESEGAGGAGAFDWERILRRKEELARTLDADWFIHHDADEFRESPWRGETLTEGIARVDAGGYNAIDFHVLNFWPTRTDKAAKDIRDRLTFHEPGRAFDRLQVKCWKKTAQPVALAPSGGHSADFAGRNIFPVRFLLRHYPIRSQEHGERKVFRERVPRFVTAEREKGWHVQYNDIAEGAAFVRDASSLTRYDPDAVRLDLFIRNRHVERLERAIEATQDLADRLSADATPLRRHLDAQDEELAKLRPERAELLESLESLKKHLANQDAELEALRAERERMLAEIETHQRHRAAQDAEVGELRQDRARRLAGEQDLQRHLAAQDAELERLRRERDQAGKLHHDLQAHVAAQDAELAGLRQVHAQLSAEHSGIVRHLATQDEEVGRLREDRMRHLAELQEKEKLQQHLQAQDGELARLRPERERLLSDLDGTRAVVAERAAEIAALKAEIDAKKAAVAILEADRAAMLASRSWKWTAPLRSVERRLGKPTS